MFGKENSYRDLKEILVHEKIADKNAVSEAVKAGKHKNIHEIYILLQAGKCDEKKLTELLSNKYNYNIVNPLVFSIAPEIIRIIPKKMAEKYVCIPMSINEKTLTVALANPLNLRAIDEIRDVSGYRIKTAVSEYSLLRESIKKYYDDSALLDLPEATDVSTLGDLAKLLDDESEENKSDRANDLIEAARNAPVVKLVNMIILEGIRRHASDIFIEPWEKEVRVRVRVDGLLEEIVCPHKSFAAAMVSRIKIMSELNIAEHRIPQDGRFKVRVKDREVDMRVSVLPTSFGEKVCLRILDTGAQGHDISKLGFTEKEQCIIKDSARKPHGMILVTGPTGSGKTTTLYSVLKYLDSPQVNITTVEDPVEYQMKGINQVNVKETIGLTFPSALRSILRQDPDIVLIGEIRDSETLDIAIKAALTGHLVLSTLHTNDAASSITRMVNLGLEPFLIASTVLMVSAQRLVRRLCPRCKYSYELEADVVKNLGLDLKKQRKFWKGKGCAQCRQSGYIGRSVITEILPITVESRELIMRGASAEELKNKAHNTGMNTLRESAIQKALSGETSLEEVFRVTSEDQTCKEDSEASYEGEVL